MTRVLDPQLKRALAERIRFYNELGVYDFYRRDPAETNPGTIENAVIDDNPVIQPELREEMTPMSKAAVALPVLTEENLSEVANSKPVMAPAQALRLIREDLGDCT